MRFTTCQNSTLYTPVLELSDEDLQKVVGGVGATPAPHPGPIHHHGGGGHPGPIHHHGGGGHPGPIHHHGGYSYTI